MIANVNRRCVLTGIATGLPFLAGCTQLLGTDQGTNKSESTETTKRLGTTATQSATEISTEMSTTNGTTAEGGEIATIDPSNLATYTDTKHSYSIKYPEGWEKSDSSDDPALTNVRFSGESGFGSTQAFPNTAENLGGKPKSLEGIVDVFIDGYKSTFEAFEVKRKRDMTLPNDHSGIAMDLHIKSQVEDGNQTVEIPMRGKAVFALANETVYDLLVVVPKFNYTSTAENGMEKIIASLTIE